MHSPTPPATRSSHWAIISASDKPWVQAKTIAQSTGIPKPYLSKILHALGKAGLLRTKRGVGGGVTLTRTPDQVTLLDIALAVEPISAQPRCFLRRGGLLR